MMCDDWVLFLDMFYIQWCRLAEKDLWNKVYMIMIMTLQRVSALKHMTA
jgi:hypothetical protein